MRAQDFPYTLTVLNETYVPLEDFTSLTGNEVWDDPELTAPIGFDFSFLNAVSDEVFILPPGSQVVGNVSSEMTTTLFYPYFADIMNAGTDAAVSDIRYVLDGEPGNLVFKIEWSNVGFYNEFEAFGTFGNTTNFQMWMHENGNVLEFRFGENTIKSPNVVHWYGKPGCMLGEEVSVDGQSWTGLWLLSGNVLSPELISVPPDIQDFSDLELLSGEPPAGTVYRFGTIPTFVEEKTIRDIALWPNPASSFIRILGNTNEEYRILDIAGHTVRSGRMQNHNVTVDIADLASGIYLVSTTSGLTKRWVKE